MALSAAEQKQLNRLNRLARSGSLTDAQIRTRTRLRQKKLATDKGVSAGRTYEPGKPIYIGVEAGSDLEQKGLPGAGANQPGATMGAKYGGPTRSYYGSVKPRYRVGYLNSKEFSRELGGMDSDVITKYQEAFYDLGLLTKFTPGKMDGPTRAIFKDMVTTANQSGKRWQDVFMKTLETGTVGYDTPGDSGPERAPFQAILDDPVTLREAFQSTAQKLYGGDLPDAEVNAMVDAFRAQQLAKQKAKYDTDETGGQIDNEVSPDDFISSEIKAKHPDQVAKVEFNGTLSSLFAETAKTGGGLM